VREVRSFLRGGAHEGGNGLQRLPQGLPERDKIAYFVAAPCECAHIFSGQRSRCCADNHSQGRRALHQQKEFEVRQSNLKSSAASSSRTTESGGRVRHDDRGAAVWDWALGTGEFNAMSSSALLRRLDVGELKMQEPTGLSLAVAGRDAGGGGDPYNRGGAENRALARRRWRVR